MAVRSSSGGQATLAPGVQESGRQPHRSHPVIPSSPAGPARYGRILAWLAGLVCLLFALRALWLVDRTSLWGDELRSVIKSFQPSLRFLFEYLRSDSHPPVYYLLLWVWGQLVGQTAVSLRLLSWLAYLLGAVLMAGQAAALAGRRGRAAVLAALMALCTPFPVRFAIEGKGYSLLVALVALALLLRRGALDRGGPSLARDAAYAGAVALAGLTHFFGVGLLGALALWDGLCRRWRLLLAAALGLLPALLWIGYASEYLFAESTNSWIDPPELSLLRNTLGRALGEDPLLRLAALLLALLGLQVWAGAGPRPAGPDRPEQRRWPRLLERSGVWGAVLMVVLVVAVSFLKPIAFGRYFIVLVPVVVPALAAAAADWRLRPRGEWLALALVVVMLVTSWDEAFRALDPPSDRFDRERDDFRSISLRLADEPWRYARRRELFEASDRILVAAGALPGPPRPWGEEQHLRERLARPDRPERVVLAAAGPTSIAQERLEDLLEISRAAGYRCRPLETLPRGALVLHCRPDRPD
jgi:4-amino-4-deoxy-L-arabinose transferase-like glycosyltransferase